MQFPQVPTIYRINHNDLRWMIIKFDLPSPSAQIVKNLTFWCITCIHTYSNNNTLINDSAMFNDMLRTSFIQDHNSSMSLFTRRVSRASMSFFIVNYIPETVLILIFVCLRYEDEFNLVWQRQQIKNLGWIDADYGFFLRYYLLSFSIIA